MLLRSSHDRAVALFGEPIDYTLFEEIGNMYYLLGHPKEAMKWYTQLLERNAAPESKMYFNIGMCWQLLKSYPDAIEAYLKSTAADSRFSKSWMNLG
jgi:tetratricopeptide (TPR) repeat protein